MSTSESGRGSESLSSQPEVARPGVLVWHHSGNLNALEQTRQRESGWLPECLRKEGFAPETVIDVGAGMGTPPLFRAFPESYHVLIEPLEECRTSLSRCLTKYNGEHIPVAIGDKEGTAEIHVDPDDYWNSSMLERAWHQPSQVAKLRNRQVPVRTLDGLLEERNWAPPFGLKLDTEGYEARVIEGAGAVLSLTQFVISEVWVGKQFREGSYTFAEFISLMDSRGFVLLDILDGAKTAMNQGTVFIDALFARTG